MAAPFAPAFANSDDHVLGPTMPSTSRPAESWYLRTAASVWGPKMPSDATPSLRLDVGHELALAPHAQRQSALTDLDRPVGRRFRGNRGAHVA